MRHVTAPKPEGLGFKGMPPHPTDTILHYLDIARKARDERRLIALHPSSGAPGLLAR